MNIFAVKTYKNSGSEFLCCFLHKVDAEEFVKKMENNGIVYKSYEAIGIVPMYVDEGEAGRW